MDVGHQHQIDPADPWFVAEKKQKYRMAVWTIRQAIASEADKYYSSRRSRAKSLKLADERASKRRTFTESAGGGIAIDYDPWLEVGFTWGLGC